MTNSELQTSCIEYLAQRVSTYEFRCKRYDAVILQLYRMGLQNGDAVLDVGAGTQDFGHRLKTNFKWFGPYIPIDGCIDGTDLNTWTPPPCDFAVCIEVLEHLRDPWRMATAMEKYARKGVIITTPNSDVVDTLGMDPTHIVPLYAAQFEQRGWQVKLKELFGTPQDSIVAWRKW